MARGAGDRSSTLPIQVSFRIISFAPKISSILFWPQGNRVSIGSTEGDSLDGVSEDLLLFMFQGISGKKASTKFPEKGGGAVRRISGNLSYFVTQVNHPSGKEKKGSVLGRFLGRKKVNT